MKEVEVFTTLELIDVMAMLEEIRDHYGWLRKDAGRVVAWHYYEERQQRAQELVDRVNAGISHGLASAQSLSELEGQRDVALDTVAELRELLRR